MGSAENAARRCRFCGLMLGRDDAGDWHAACVDAPLDEAPPSDDHAHPMYGPKLVAYYDNG